MTRYCLLFFIIAIGIVIPCKAQYLYASRSYSADTLTHAQLSAILNNTNDKTIVGLGEATHLKSTYYRIKSQLVKALITQQQFNLLLLEASLNTCQQLDKYVKGESNADLRSLLPAMNATNGYVLHNLFNTQEIFDLLNWIKAYNREHNNAVSIAGIDFQTPAMLTKEIRSGLQQIASEQPQLKDSVSQLEKNLLAANTVYEKFYHGYMDYRNIFLIFTKDSLKQMAADAASKVRSAATFTEAHTTNPWLIANVRSLSVLSNFYIDPNAAILRDSMMYNNMVYAMNTRPGAKAMVWAAVQHLQDQKIKMGTGQEYYWMGSFINRHWGNKFMHIGVHGEIDCLPAAVTNNTVGIELIIKEKNSLYGKCFENTNEHIIIGVKAAKITDAVVL
nr:erythromycin esterase family protein [uncultured Chitinophaga sp.]